MLYHSEGLGSVTYDLIRTRRDRAHRHTHWHTLTLTTPHSLNISCFSGWVFLAQHTKIRPKNFQDKINNHDHYNHFPASLVYSQSNATNHASIFRYTLNFSISLSIISTFALLNRTILDFSLSSSVTSHFTWTVNDGRRMGGGAKRGGQESTKFGAPFHDELG